MSRALEALAQRAGNGTRLALLALLVGSTATLWLLGVPTAALGRWWCLLGLGFYLPGRLFTPRDYEPSLALATSMAIGMCIAAILWGGCLLGGVPPRLSFVALLVLAIFAFTKRPSHGIESVDARVIVASTLALVTVAITQFGNAVAGGELGFFSTYFPEGLFHCHLAQQMRHSLPLEFPAGVRVSYHVAYDVLAAVMLEATGASMLDVHYRLMPALLVPLATVSAAAFATSLGYRSGAAAAGALGLFLADDLSWIAALLGWTDATRTGAPEWDVTLGAPVLYALHHNRGFLAGLPVFFAGVSGAAWYFRKGGRGSLWTAALLIAASIEFKVFFFLTSAAALAVTATSATRHGIRGNAKLARTIALLAATTCLSVPFLAFLASFIIQKERPFELLPGYPVLMVLLRLGFFASTDAVKTAIAARPVAFALAWAPLGLTLFSLGTLGARSVGLVPLACAWRRGHAAGALAAAIVVVTYGVTVLLVTPPARENIVYFWGIGLCVLGVVAGAEIGRQLARVPRARRIRLLIFAAAAIAALPGTTQLILVGRSFVAEPLATVPSGLVAVAARLDREARPGDVILESDSRYSLLAALSRVNPVIAWPEWARNVVGREPVVERLADVRQFFRERRPENTQRILERYRVDWIWVPRELPAPPALPRLRLDLSNGEGALYHVEREAR